jgi:hypothetical protein
VKRAGGLWEPGSRQWLVERRRIGPLVRQLRRDTDPLFRRAGMDLEMLPAAADMLSVTP